MKFFQKFWTDCKRFNFNLFEMIWHANEKKNHQTPATAPMYFVRFNYSIACDIIFNS